MLRLKKAMAVVQYSILIGIVAIALTTMNMYMRRSIQAKVKDLSDALIGTEGVDFDRGLDYLVQTVYIKEIESNSVITDEDQIGGSTYRDVSSGYEMDSFQLFSSNEDGRLRLGRRAEDPYVAPIFPY